jgi:drug/metabolite transporter (DMT)-like permease
VAVVAGVLVLDESLSPAALAGLALILAGSWLATRPTSAPVEREPPRAATPV